MGWLSRLLGGKAAQAQSTPPREVDSERDAPASGMACEHPDIDRRAALTLRADSPEFDEFIARAELEAGSNLPHGAQHLANLLVIDPRHAGWHALLQGYVAAAGDALEQLVPDGEPRHASTETLRAWIWQAQGRHDDALVRLTQAAHALGSTDLLHAWALDWLEPPGAIERVSREACMRAVSWIVAGTGEVAAASAWQLASVRRWSALLERVAPTWQADSLLRMTRASLLRKSGRFDEALALAGPLEDARDYNDVVAIGLALRAQGRLDEAARAFERGASLETDGITAWLEAADSWLEADQMPQALAAYERALHKVPAHDWAHPSAAYCRWRLDGGDPWTQPVGLALKAGNERARALLFRHFGAIDESGDASANILRQLRTEWRDKPPTDAAMKFRINTIEAPSNRLALELEVAAFGLVPAITITYGSVPKLDPRRAVADVAFALWRWDDSQPAPGLPAPAGAIASAIASLASQPYDPWRNWAQASHVAAELGADAVSDVLATMVHPPPLPAGTSALAWLARVQLAAAMVVAQVERDWAGSRRRAALHALLLGPADWTTSAGIDALTWVARTEPAHALDIHRLFEERERHLPTEGHWDWVRRLYVGWQTVPGLFDNEREALKARLATLDAQE